MDIFYIALSNIPSSYNEELMTEYIEGTLDVDVVNVKIIERMALFSISQNIQDFEVAARMIKQESREGHEMKLFLVKARAKNAVVIYDIKPTLDVSSLKKYIKQEYTNVQGSVSSFRICLKHNLGFVHFKVGSDRLVNKLLSKKRHTISATIKFEPFFYNFHDVIEKELNLLNHEEGNQCYQEDNPRDYETYSKQISEGWKDYQVLMEGLSDQGVEGNVGNHSSIESLSDQELEGNVGNHSSSESLSDQELEGNVGNHSSIESLSDQDKEGNVGIQSSSECLSDQASSKWTHREDQSSGNNSNKDGEKFNAAECEDLKCFTNLLFENSLKNQNRKYCGGKAISFGSTESGDSNGNIGDINITDTKLAGINLIAQCCTPLKQYGNFIPCTLKTGLNDRKAQTMSEAHYLLMKKHFGSFMNSTVHYNSEFKSAVIEGKKTEVVERYQKLLFDLKKIKTCNLELTGCLPKIITKEKAKFFFAGLKEMKSISFCIENNRLVLASKSTILLSTATEKLRDILNYKESAMSKYQIPREELESLKKDLENQLLVEISWNMNQDEIIIEGFKDDVKLSKIEAEKLLERFNEVCKEFVIKGNVAKYLRKNPLLDISTFQNVTIKTNDNGTEITYVFTGQKSAVNEVEDFLKSLVEKITTIQIDFQKEGFTDADIKLITMSCNTPEMQNKICFFEREKKCLLKIKLPNETAFKVKGYIPRTKPISDIFSVTTSSCIKIKEGDIIDEQMDVLVCVLDESINLRKTQIGKAFIRAVPELNDRLKIIQRDNPDSDVLTVPGPFSNPYTSCLAICGIVLSKWDEDKSPALLENKIIKILDEAIKLGAKSMAFPALGHGRMFKFPSDKVSQIMVDSFVSHLTSNPELKEICIVSNDEEMHINFKLEAEKKLQKFSRNTCTVEDNSDTEDDMDQDMGENIVIDLEEAVNTEISVTIAKTNKPNGTLKSLIKLIRTHCLHFDYIEDELLPVISQDVKKKVQRYVIHLRIPSDKKIIEMKGFLLHIVELKAFITCELDKIRSTLQNHTIICGEKPQRGTLEFVQYASTITEMCPSYWKVFKDPSFLRRLVNKVYPSKHKKVQEIIVCVNNETKKAVTDLFIKTWDPKKTGIGVDAINLIPNTTVEVLNVERVENFLLFEPYASIRKSLFDKYARMGKLCDDFSSTLPRGQIKTTELAEDFLKEQLYQEVNEHYLFHGTKKDLIEKLTQCGPDPKLCTHGMLGRGVYLAEMSTKSDQYADSKVGRTNPGEELKMLMMRVLLGNTYIVNRDHPKVQRGASQFLRPPCHQCKSEQCPNADHVDYDSVTLDSSPNDSRTLFREFVVYDKSSCYPEYIITYRRVINKNRD